MKKEYWDLIEKFKKARMGLLVEVQRFPEEYRSRKLFGDWSLKDVLIHIIAWDAFTVDLVEDFVSGIDPYDIEDNDKFNKQAIKEYEGNWDEVHEDFIESGALLIETCKSVPENLWEKRIWENKNRTLKRELEIDTSHYMKHLEEIREVVKGLGS